MPMTKNAYFHADGTYNQCNVLAMHFIRKYQFTSIYTHAPIKSDIIVYELIP